MGASTRVYCTATCEVLTMLTRFLYCPSCRRARYEYEFQLEGEVPSLDMNAAFHCDGCGWHGYCRELSDTPPVLEPELDFQI